MKATLGWLRQHLESDAPLDRITETLTRIGLEVERIEDRAHDLAPFIVGAVVDARPHPNADRLRLCVVDTGQERVQVVCGAPNAVVGLKSAFAAPGTQIPATGQRLKASVIRGEASNGMLCSERELGLSGTHDGVIALPPETPTGMAFAAAAGLDDPILDIAVTPNRGDCMAVRGIARDLAAAGLGTLKPLYTAPAAPVCYESPLRWALADDAVAACQFVAGRSFRGVRNGPAPEWMQRRLRAAGLRPLSALVDIANYVMLDLGQPLHTYDAARLDGDCLWMTLSRDGEALTTLDGCTRRMPGGIVTIRDARGPQGIGGLMGGAASACGEETVAVFLEAALFDPIQIATAGRRLDIRSDARQRFERGIDPNGVLPALAAASHLILTICGGEASAITSAGALPTAQRRATMRFSRFRALAGAPIADTEAEAALQASGFELTRDSDGDTLTAVIPSWRADVEGEHGLIGEALRLHGLDRIPATALTRTRPASIPAATAPRRRRDVLIRRRLATRGLYEAITWSFMAAADAALFATQPPTLTVANPLSADLDTLRPTPLGNLARAAARNAGRGLTDIALFEVGPAFTAPDRQIAVAVGLRSGRTGPRHWAAPPRPVDVFDAKADALAVLDSGGLAAEATRTTRDAPAYYHPGRSGALRLGPTLLAVFGELHPYVTRALGLKNGAVAFEVFLEAMPEPRAQRAPTPPSLPDLTPVRRDLAFLTRTDTAADDLARTAAAADRRSISDVAVFDVYQGPELKGQRSIALAITLQPSGTTPTEADIQAVMAKVVAAVTHKTGATLRDG